jgi:hypothetical protein
LFEWIEWTDRSYGAKIFILLFMLQTVSSYGAKNEMILLVFWKDNIQFRRNELFVESNGAKRMKWI